MMRRRPTLVAAVMSILIGMVSEGPAQGQEKPTVTLESLRTPTSPAFVLLGVEPTSIERPTTPKALAINVLSAAGDGDDLIPRNYALEVAPYWLIDHPDLEFEDFYDPTPWQGIKQSLSISLATKDLTDDADGIEGTAAGLGLNLDILTGKPKPELEDTTEHLAAFMDLLRANDFLAAFAASAGEILDASGEDELSSWGRGPLRIQRTDISTACPATDAERRTCGRITRARELCALRRGLVRSRTFDEDICQEPDQIPTRYKRIPEQLDAYGSCLLKTAKQGSEFQSFLTELLSRSRAHAGAIRRAIDGVIGRQGLNCDDLFPPNDPVTHCECQTEFVLPTENVPTAQRETASKLRSISEESLALTEDYRDKLELDKLTLEVQEGLTERIGWHITASSAVTIDIPDEDFDLSKFSRVGFWFTPSYRWQTPALDFLGVARYTRELRGDNEDLADFGARLIWHLGRLALSAEALYRVGLTGGGESGDTERAVGMLEYRLTDNLYLVGTFGKDFDSEGDEKDTLISVLGVNFGFGKAPKLAVPN